MDLFINQPLPDEMLSINDDDNIAINEKEILSELKNVLHNGSVMSKYYCAKCLKDGTLIVNFSDNITGYMPREEVSYVVEKDGKVHLGKCSSRVGLPLQFKVKDIKTENGKTEVSLTRKDVVVDQRDKFIQELKVGVVVKGVVTGFQQYGAFVDIGGDIKSVLSVQHIKRVFVKTPEEALNIGQVIDVVVTEINIDDNKNVELKLSRVELLPGWDEIDKMFATGETVLGKIKSALDTGVFIELNDSFEGVADFPVGRKFKYGEKVRVKILNINKKARRIRLKIV